MEDNSVTDVDSEESGDAEGATPDADDELDDDGMIKMSLDEFRAHRLDAWDFAYARLKGPDKDWGSYEVDAGDVMILARFIEGIEGEGV